MRYAGQRGRNERRAGVFLDVAHLILGIAIVIFAVLSIINPEGNKMLFPLVFLLAALLNGITESSSLRLVAGTRNVSVWGRSDGTLCRPWASWRVKRSQFMVLDDFSDFKEQDQKENESGDFKILKRKRLCIRTGTL